MAQATANEMPLVFTERALNRIKAILAKPENQGKGLRVFVLGGGCAGLQYGMALGLPKEGDLVMEGEGYTILIDPKSYSLLQGTRLDYYETLQSSGFKFFNPNALASCGCGISFKPKTKVDIAKPQPCH